MARAQMKSQYTSRVYAALPWLSLFRALGVSGMKLEHLAGEEPKS